MTGAVGQLLRLHCTVNRVVATTYQPQNLAVLEALFNRLRDLKRKVNLLVTFNGVQLNFKRTFAEHRLERKLLDLHFSGRVMENMAVSSCRTVSQANYLQMLDTFEALSRPIMNGALAEGETPAQGMLNNLYPNLQTIIVDNSDQRRALSAELLLNHLRHFRDLTQLLMCRTGFASDWYQSLPTVSSLLSLENLSFMEAYGAAVIVNFDFVDQLPALRYLKTNLATRPAMLRAIEEMREDREFHFHFWSNQEEVNCFRCKVRRHDATQFYLRIDVYDYLDLESIETLYNYPTTFEDLQTAFNHPENAHITRHWLDPPVQAGDQVPDNGQAPVNDPAQADNPVPDNDQIQEDNLVQLDDEVPDNGQVPADDQAAQ